jgi:glutamine amidotransferase
MPLIAVANFGTGNLRSVHKAIERVADKGVRVVVTEERFELEKADRVVWPGQGAIGTCVRALDTLGLRETFDKILATRPLLGICLGLQAMYEFSEEGGGVTCIGALKGTVRHFGSAGGNFNFQDPVTAVRLKIPHMGWNNVTQTRPHPLWRGIDQGQRFYFVHSYCAHSADPAQEYGTTEYGSVFTAAGGRDNYFGVQFHPEKSQSAGLQLLKNFVEWDGSV